MPSGSNVDLGGRLQSLGYSAGALNADLIPSMDVSNYKWISLYVGPDTYSGVLTFQGSFNGTDWISITMYRLGNLDGAHSISSVSNETSTLYGAPIRFPLFRCRMTSYTSGMATGILELRSEGLEGLSLTGTNQAVGVLSGQYIIGAICNDGVHNVAVAAGTAADTTIYTGKSMLGSVLVTTTGTSQMNIYDNTSSSGVIVGLIPTTATVTGVPYVFRAFCATGITIKGNALNPGVTVFYSDLF